MKNTRHNLLQPTENKAKTHIYGVSRPAAILAIIAGAMGLASCQEQDISSEPAGAYLLFRTALLSKNAPEIYSLLDRDTKGVFDGRVQVLNDMSSKIVRFLPVVDQRLAKKQTGVIILDQAKIETGESLFKYLFRPDSLEVTKGIEVGTEIDEVEIGDDGKTATVVTYSGETYNLVLEEDKVWRVTSWKGLATGKTKWIMDNQSALDQTVEDLIKEDKDQIDAVITFLLKEDKERRKERRK